MNAQARRGKNGLADHASGAVGTTTTLVAFREDLPRPAAGSLAPTFGGLETWAHRIGAAPGGTAAALRHVQESARTWAAPKMTGVDLRCVESAESV